MTPKQKYQILVESLRLIAASKDQQLSVLPDFVSPTDEIATGFGDAFLLIPQLEKEGLISQEAAHALVRLDNWFENMPGDQEFTKIDALESHSFWQGARELASTALTILGEDQSPPNLSHIYWSP